MNYAFRSLIICLVPLCLSITGCGFKLRGAQQLPDGITQVQLTSALAHMPLTRALQRQFKLYQIPLVENVPESMRAQTISIKVMPDTLDRRLLSLFASGQVAEYELILSISYQVEFPNQAAQRINFDVSREYQDDPNAILAKSRELQLVLTEMRQNAADRIIRLLQSQAGNAN